MMNHEETCLLLLQLQPVRLLLLGLALCLPRPRRRCLVQRSVLLLLLLQLLLLHSNRLSGAEGSRHHRLNETVAREESRGGLFLLRGLPLGLVLGGPLEPEGAERGGEQPVEGLLGEQVQQRRLPY